MHSSTGNIFQESFPYDFDWGMLSLYTFAHIPTTFASSCGIKLFIFTNKKVFNEGFPFLTTVSERYMTVFEKKQTVESQS